MFPAPVFSQRASWISCPGPSAAVPMRKISPQNPRGIYLHIHGGGWVLGAADLQDTMLERLSEATGLMCLSVDYRLAPESKYPSAVEDCLAAAVYVAENSEALCGESFIAIGGESSGAHIAASVLCEMAKDSAPCAFQKTVLVSGFFDLSLSQSAQYYGEDRPILRTSDCKSFVSAFLPEGTDKAQGSVSPINADLSGLCSAFFAVGTNDALVDDTLLMATRWHEAGNEAQCHLYPGAVHGFNAMPSLSADHLHRSIAQFLNQPESR